jgi:hypothetical protein
MPQFFLAKNAMDWERMDCLGGYQYGISKSTILQEIAKRHIDLRRSTKSWRHHNKEIIRCSLYIINGMLFISIDFLIQKYNFFLFTVCSVEATSKTSKMDANLMAHMKLAQELYRSLCVILLTTFDDDDVTSQMSLFTR